MDAGQKIVNIFSISVNHVSNLLESGKKNHLFPKWWHNDVNFDSASSSVTENKCNEDTIQIPARLINWIVECCGHQFAKKFLKKKSSKFCLSLFLVPSKFRLYFSDCNLVM